MDTTPERDEDGDEPAGEARAPSADGQRDGGRRSRRLGRRVRHGLSQAVVRALGILLPWLYVTYCRLVWATSRVEDRTQPMRNGMARHGRFVGLLWHQEVFTVAWSYRGFRPHTLASLGNFGHIITRLLERCGFVVFRGGSSRGTARRRKVLPELIHHMRTTPGVAYGITVDGSNGPAFELKHGGPMIARACRAPVFLARLWCSRRLELPTWDRTVIPLPFGRILMECIGPYWVDPDASSVEFQRTVAHLQEELLALSDHAARAFAPGGDPALRASFPPGWESPWPPGQVGRRNTRWDLREDVWPPWAALASEPPR